MSSFKHTIEPIAASIRGSVSRSTYTHSIIPVA